MRASPTPPRAAAKNPRVERRAAARTARIHRRRRVTAACAVALLAALLIASSGLGGSPRSKPPRPRAAAFVPKVVPGGPLAPARVGGLAALWAPQNVIGGGPTTATTYRAAASLPGLPGFLLIADRGNNRILIVNSAGKIIFRYPSAADLAAGRKLFYNDDTFVEPGGRGLIANEEDNHAIVEIGIADHALHFLFGHPGHVGGGPTHLNTPDDAYALADGSFTVADAYNCRVLFIRSGVIIRQIGRSGHCVHDPPRSLGAVNGDTPEHDGGILISEIAGSWIDEIGPDGGLRYAMRAPVSYPSDPQPLPGGRVLLADYARPGRVLIMDHYGHVLWSYGPHAGPGRMDHPSLAMALPNGDIAVNDDYRHRVIVVNPRTKQIVWQYGHTDIPGTAPGYLNTPDGMDFIPASPDGSPDYAAVVHL